MVSDDNVSGKTMSYYYDIMVDSLEKLAEQRTTENLWDDDEQDSGILKTCEALETFFSPYVIGSSNLKPNILDDKIIIDDIIKINAIVDKDGYLPDPYLDVKEDFTDCVAFVLRLNVHINKYLKDKNITVDDKLKIDLNSNINKCIDWLMNNSLCTASTCCWDAIKMNTEKKDKAFGNVYFTYSAMVALSHTLAHFKLTDNKQKNIQQVLQKGGNWLNERYNEDIGRFFGGVIQTDSNIIYTPYAIIAIITSWDYQTSKVKKTVEKSISSLMSIYQKDPIEFSQRAYYRFTYEKGKRQMLYEDRSTIATTLTALSLAANRDLELDVVNTPYYYRLLNSIAEELVSYRDEHTKLWNKAHDFLIYYNQRAMEALALFIKYGKVTQIQLNEYEMRLAIKNGLMREEVIKAVMDSIQRQVNLNVAKNIRES